MTSVSNDIDPLVLQNRIAIVTAQRRRLIESLLRPPTAEELRNAKSAEAIAAEEEELWKPRPATLGAGHPIPASTSATETYNRENDLLRRRLLGQSIMKDARQRHQERTKQQARPRGIANSGSGGDDDHDDHEEEEQMSRGAIANRSSKKRKFRAGDGHHAEAESVNIQHAESDSDVSIGGGFVSLATKAAALERGKIKKGQKAQKREAASKDSYHDEDGPDIKAASAKNTEISSADSLTQRILTGEKVVLVGEDKKEKKKRKKIKNKNHNSSEG
ncbi:hypothetical protein TWF225_001306 [Orbilia oligospora]|uniref:Uncharacterized protein n=1 Tax=Orbilia oligospora TaxID=2813651 RepID=A0A7C8JV73_ORBOL|nr:hypothetical protein TWF751_003819 [Orbilia oligospora]KAF3165167.1 hypothetical protein TWF225_001306 [Orbilia oligospora]KAF3234150.1 hypothetical protein TWF217_004227 [Orbilia oligospora]KAF3260645.1 hypothetical protein TWF128_003288 [Orbilia oligospora]KAF3274829.1 hypothetical protein TWF132_003235 [Orbilia oligospora]